MSGINGTLALLKIGSKYVTGQLGGSFDESVDIIDVTTKFSSEAAKEKIGGEIGGSGSIECAIDPSDSTNASYADVKATLRARELVAFAFGDQTTVGSTYETGNLILSGVSKAIPQNDRITFTVNFETSGPITTATVAS
jgi:predicted secreted protein